MPKSKYFDDPGVFVPIALANEIRGRTGKWRVAGFVSKTGVFSRWRGKNGWARLAKNLRVEVDRGLISAYHGVKSLPFDAGQYRRVAVKIVGDRRGNP